MKKTILSCLFTGVMAVSSIAHADIIKSWTGSSNFDDATISFGAGFVSGGLLGIQDSNSDGYVHDHGGFSGLAWSMQINLDNVWTNIAGGNLGAGGSFTLTNLAGLTWNEGLVTGLKFSSNPNQNQSYHNMDNMSFKFADANVPEPATLALLGLGLLGLGFSRRKSA